jgi:hypothetical protein
MSESLRPSRGFGGEGFKGFKNYIRPKEDNMARRPRRVILNESETKELVEETLDKLSTKDTNPKDAVGVKKPPLSTVSGPVMAELGLAMMEGARKYGRHNYRDSGVRASIYFDATFRHIVKWWEGQDVDPDSGLNHITKAIASLFVLRDAMIFDNWVDDRPPAIPDANAFWKHMEKLAADIIKKYPESKEPFTNEKVS